MTAKTGIGKSLRIDGNRTVFLKTLFSIFPTLVKRHFPTPTSPTLLPYFSLFKIIYCICNHLTNKRIRLKCNECCFFTKVHLQWNKVLGHGKLQSITINRSFLKTLIFIFPIVVIPPMPTNCNLSEVYDSSLFVIRQNPCNLWLA